MRRSSLTTPVAQAASASTTMQDRHLNLIIASFSQP
jgi:hypothetical protein